MNHTDIPAAPLDLVSLALKSVSDQKLTLRIEIAGRIESEQMQKALSLTVVHYPILACQLYTQTGQSTAIHELVIFWERVIVFYTAGAVFGAGLKVSL